MDNPTHGVLSTTTTTTTSTSLSKPKNEEFESKITDIMIFAAYRDEINDSSLPKRELERLRNIVEVIESLDAPSAHVTTFLNLCEAIAKVEKTRDHVLQRIHDSFSQNLSLKIMISQSFRRVLEVILIAFIAIYVSMTINSDTDGVGGTKKNGDVVVPEVPEVPNGGGSGTDGGGSGKLPDPTKDKDECVLGEIIRDDCECSAKIVTINDERYCLKDPTVKCAEQMMVYDANTKSCSLCDNTEEFVPESFQCKCRAQNVVNISATEKICVESPKDYCDALDKVLDPTTSTCVDKPPVDNKGDKGDNNKPKPEVPDKTKDQDGTKDKDNDKDKDDDDKKVPTSSSKGSNILIIVIVAIAVVVLVATILLGIYFKRRNAVKTVSMMPDDDSLSQDAFVHNQQQITYNFVN